MSEKEPVLPARLGRYRVRSWVDAGSVAQASDTIGERSAELTRVPFGVERAEARDEAIARWRSLTSVAHPALRAVLDSGAWEDDAFVAEEELASPVTPLPAWDGDDAARSRVIAELLGAASVLAEKRLRLSSVEASVDGYGQPKLAGLRDSTEGDGSLDARIVELAAGVARDEALGARVRSVTQAGLPSLLAELARASGHPMTPFAADVARGEQGLAGPARSRQMTVALVLIALAFAVIAVLALAAR